MNRISDTLGPDPRNGERIRRQLVRTATARGLGLDDSFDFSQVPNEVLLRVFEQQGHANMDRAGTEKGEARNWLTRGSYRIVNDRIRSYVGWNCWGARTSSRTLT